MALVFHRRLALPLWATVLFTVALAALPAAMPSLITVFGIGGLGVLAFIIVMLIPSLGTSLSVVHVASHRQLNKGVENASKAAYR